LDGRVKPGHAVGGRWVNLFELWFFCLAGPSNLGFAGRLSAPCRERWYKPVDKRKTPAAAI
jgi:hypothetical protein